MNYSLIGTISVCSGLLIGLTSVVFSFINKQQKNNVEKLKHEKEILHLEVEKEKATLKKLEMENQKYDNEIKSLEDTDRSNSIC
jgi:uncharacterized protein YlxW (UPF0749 family)